MKKHLKSIALLTIISFLFFTGKANTINKLPITDTICCPPDSLKVVSTNFPVFCVSWKVSADSSCKLPFGFEVEWRPFPGSGPWTTKVKIYTGGTLVTFCDSVSVCSGYQWRVRTICDSTSGGTATYSAWVYGNKFAMTCGNLQILNSDADRNNPPSSKRIISPQVIKSKEN